MRSQPIRAFSGSLAIAAACLAPPAAAQPPAPADQAAIVTPLPRASPGPDPVASRTLAALGNGHGAVACAQCHGLDGSGDGSGAFPRLAGQPVEYLYKQLNDYADGIRKNAIMGPIAAALNDRERQDAAAYYARLNSPYFPAPPAPAANLQQGAMLSAIGSPDRRVQACVNCHGPASSGQAPLYPQLAGQYANYIALQFRMFREGYRQNDVAGVMRQIAGKLSDDEIASLAAYLQSVTPEPGR